MGWLRLTPWRSKRGEAISPETSLGFAVFALAAVALLALAGVMLARGDVIIALVPTAVGVDLARRR